MMPEMNGLQVLAKIRKVRPDLDLPVIMVTAMTESQDVVEALNLGANDYITKPVDFPVALARIEAQLASKRSYQQLLGQLRPAEQDFRNSDGSRKLTRGRLSSRFRPRSSLNCSPRRKRYASTLGHMKPMA